MKNVLLAATLAAAFVASARAGDAPPAPAAATVTPGAPAPDFTLKGDDGSDHTLSKLKGKYVVLEWYNKDCPFVKRHYGTKNMQQLQKRYTDKGVVWFEVATSAPGKQGHLDAKGAAAARKKFGINSSAILLDSRGDVGRLYSAKSTPHMFVIDPKGNVIYMGAIDDLPSTDWSDIKNAHNYVADALDASMSGQPVAKPVTTPYGCGVKY
jgi:peroxiredoxin